MSHAMDLTVALLDTEFHQLLDSQPVEENRIHLDVTLFSRDGRCLAYGGESHCEWSRTRHLRRYKSFCATWSLGGDGISEERDEEG